MGMCQFLSLDPSSDGEAITALLGVSEAGIHLLSGDTAHRGLRLL